MRAKINGEIRTLMMGAPEFVSKLAPVDKETQKKLNDWADNGLRVLMLAEFSDDKNQIERLEKRFWNGNWCGYSAQFPAPWRC
ncbi:hypothetical protein KOY48_02285 [Candidatus Minimicrobia naudis]|uniref:Uncharacterized protein n=1 Tax=Candidatus Minimicrobia naudis TaxID=2841263 RepID=A0A8F1MBX7_9BACT|nr:hypothetical protein KOY48_02285 [Candidatus Minimicrobia naudis]